MDSYLLFKRNRSGPSATPILVKNYCIRPDLRTHLDSLMSAGLVPGPHTPKDYHSFLIPYDNECAQLAYGVRTFDAATRDFITLRGYNNFHTWRHRRDRENVEHQGSQWTVSLQIMRNQGCPIPQHLLCPAYRPKWRHVGSA